MIIKVKNRNFVSTFVSDDDDFPEPSTRNSFFCSDYKSEARTFNERYKMKHEKSVFLQVYL